MGHAIYHDSFSTDMSRNEIFNIVNQRAIEEGDYQSPLHKPVRWYEDTCLNSLEEATEFIARNDDGWYDQLAVKYKHQTDFKPSGRLEELNIRLERAQYAYCELADTPHFKNHSSNFIGCKECGSKLAREYIQNRCPLCRADLRPKSVQERIQNLYEKAEDLKQSIKSQENKERSQQLDKAKEFWFVKTEFHV